MTTTDLEFQPFDGAPGSDGQPAPGASSQDLERLTDVTVELTVEVGRTRMSLGETLALGPGSVVTLDRLADQPVDLLVNGRPIARGEVVVIDEEFGLRITEVIGAESAAARSGAVVTAAPAAASAPPEPELSPEEIAKLVDAA
jgi:flagellar motor switch protein FliN/FliY